MARKIKAGTRIEISGFNLGNEMVWYPAKVCRIMPDMLPLPGEGWWPVKYDGDKRCGTLCHESGFRIVDNRKT